MRVTFQLLDYDTKRVHYFQQLFHATEGWMSATSENMTLHVDMTAKKVAPFPDKSHAHALRRMKAAHCPPAASRGRRPPHRDAGEELAVPNHSGRNPSPKWGCDAIFRAWDSPKHRIKASEWQNRRVSNSPECPRPPLAGSRRARARRWRRPISPA